MSEQPNPFIALILAAGQGKRMKSDLPKVLHPIAERPLVLWTLEAARQAGAAKTVVVVGHRKELVEEALAPYGDQVSTAVQREQKGTGHAVAEALAQSEKLDLPIVVLFGDCPLIPPAAIAELTRARPERLTMLTSRITDPTGYGRILRDETGRVTGIREHRDCSPAELEIDEVNPGLFFAPVEFLKESVNRLSPKNAQGELYLTEIVEMAKGDVFTIDWPMEDLLGINDRVQLAQAEACMHLRMAEELARDGVVVRRPSTLMIGADCSVEPGAILEANVSLRGRTTVAKDARIDVGAVLTDVEVKAGALLKPYTVATDSVIGEEAHTGPFTHLRPGSNLGPESRVGNFVEVKKTVLGRGSKANHLAYLGDGVIGEGVNVGAGTIFCNYDGFQKHTTTLEDGVFIGSDSQLVAPVTVGKGAYVATGTTVTKNVPANALAIGRTKQANKEGYASRLRAQMQAKKDANKH